LRHILAEGVTALADPARSSEGPAWRRWLPQPAPAAELLTDHLMQGNLPAVRGVVRESQDTGADYVELATRLFQPSLYRIGELWQQNRVSVAQEHLATAIVQNQLAQIYAAADVGPANGRRAVFACVEGNQHAIGLRMVCDAFELAGWEVQYLGANLPLAALIGQVAQLRPHLVGLSASLTQQIPTLRNTILALRAEFDGPDQRCPEIMIGGLATNQIDSVWRSLDADHWAPSADQTIAAKLAGRLPS
jgi:methanogenic corrinoid protein MtbC1